MWLGMCLLFSVDFKGNFVFLLGHLVDGGRSSPSSGNGLPAWAESSPMQNSAQTGRVMVVVGENGFYIVACCSKPTF